MMIAAVALISIKIGHCDFSNPAKSASTAGLTIAIYVFARHRLLGGLLPPETCRDQECFDRQ
jgi:hypothetical protein